MIRTSAGVHISDFMYGEYSYAEMYFPEILWPDFDKQALCDAVVEYQRRQRRFGGR